MRLELGAPAARTGTGGFKLIYTLLGLLEDSLPLVKIGDSVTLYPGSFDT